MRAALRRFIWVTFKPPARGEENLGWTPPKADPSYALTSFACLVRTFSCENSKSITFVLDPIQMVQLPLHSMSSATEHSCRMLPPIIITIVITFRKLQVLHQRTTLLIGDGSAIHAPSVRSRQLDVRKHFLVSTFPSKSVNKTTHGASATKCSMHCSQCLQAANQGS